MTDNKSLLEQIQAAELKGASAEDKFAARLASCSDEEFRRVSSYLCNLGDKEKAREANQPPKPQPSVVTDDGSLSHLDGAAYDAHLRGMGINSNLATLSESVASDRERASNEDFDVAVSKWQRRQSGNE
jgi:hypothetical protein